MGVEVRSELFDVSDRVAWAAYARNVRTTFGAVHQIYNCAGIAAIAPLTEISDAELERTVDVNLWGVVNGTKAFLPHLIESGDGTVVNISSIEGLIGYASLTAYCTSKFAVRGFTEALRVEMLTEGHPVRVHVVHPGSVRTQIFDNARPAAERPRTRSDAKLLSPVKAAHTIVEGVARDRARILVARDSGLVDKLVRLVPSSYPRVIAAAQRRERARAGR